MTSQETGGLYAAIYETKDCLQLTNILVYTSYHVHKACAPIFDKLNILCCSLSSHAMGDDVNLC